MKKYIVTMVVALVLCSCGRKGEADTQKVIEENVINYDVKDDHIDLSYKINSVEKDKQRDGTYKITSNGMNNTYDEVPLPYISYVLALPLNTDIDKVVVESKGEMKTIEDIEVSGLQLEKLNGTESESYEEGGCKTVVFVQSFKGIKVAYITLYPFMYNTVEQTLSWLSDAKVSVQLKEDTWDLSHLESLDDVRRYVDNLEMIDEYKSLLNFE